MLQVIGHHAVGVGPEVRPCHRSVDGHLLVVPVSRLDFVLLNDRSILTEVYLHYCVVVTRRINGLLDETSNVV